MDRRGALIFHRRWLNLEHGDGNAAPIERQRAHHTDRTRADHHDAWLAFS
jgi:hypothetical protein